MFQIVRWVSLKEVELVHMVDPKTHFGFKSRPYDHLNTEKQPISRSRGYKRCDQCAGVEFEIISFWLQYSIKFGVKRLP